MFRPGCPVLGEHRGATLLKVPINGDGTPERHSYFVSRTITQLSGDVICGLSGSMWYDQIVGNRPGPRHSGSRLVPVAYPDLTKNGQ